MIRKIVTICENVYEENGMPVSGPKKKIAVAAVFKNPFAGEYAEDLSELYDWGQKLGSVLGEEICAVCGITAEEAIDVITGYGKGVIVGTDGELEHAHAIMHPKLGSTLRKSFGGAEHCRAIMPSTAKVGAPGLGIDVPIHNKNDEWSINDYDTIEVRVNDAPHADEIMVVIAASVGGRPLPRVGTV